LVKKVKQILDHVVERASYYCLLLSGVLILLMAWASSYGVMRRYVLHNPEPYSYELSIVFLLACVVLSIAHIQRLGRHLRVDFVASRLPEGVQAILLDIVCPILALFYVGILTWQSWADAWYSLQIGEVSTSVWRIPLFPVKLVVPIGAGLLCLVLVAQLYRGITSLKEMMTKTRK
jgi:TRAP-type C4-dicarboxylate transport system permease small subunit